MKEGSPPQPRALLTTKHFVLPISTSVRSILPLQALAVALVENDSHCLRPLSLSGGTLPWPDTSGLIGNAGVLQYPFQAGKLPLKLCYPLRCV